MKASLPRGSYSGRSTNINPQVVQNLYPELDQEGGKSVLSLQGTPGMVERVTLNASAVGRGLYVMGGVLYAAVGSKLYSVSTAWAKTELGDLDTSTGPVYFDDDGTYLALADRTSGYSYHTGTATFAEISDADFIGANAMSFMDGYFITCADQRFQISSLLDPTAWAAVDVANVRGRSDDLVTVIPYNNYLWCLGDRTAEIFYNTGNSAMPFEKYPGGFFERGLASSGAVCRSNDALYWFTDDREWIQAKGFTVTKVSTAQLDYQFKTLGTISDAIMFVQTEAGHTFIWLTFPTDSKTYVYDETNGLIHTRASYDSGTGLDIRHHANAYAYFNGYHCVLHYSDGKLYTLDLNTYVDGSSRIRRIATFPSLYDPDSRKKLQINRFEVEFEAGVGLTAGAQGEDPQAMLDYSKDGGHTWSNERWTSIGKIGEYGRRAFWNRCGQSLDFIPRVTITDPVKCIIVNAYADVERLSR